MVDLEVHCFPTTTILSRGGATWELGSPFSSDSGTLQLYGPHVQPAEVDFSVAVITPEGHQLLDWTVQSGQ